MRDRIRFMMAGWLGVALLVASAGIIHRPLSADDSLSRYYAGLRERGLYRLAESDCLRRLADQQVTPGEQADLSIELSQLYAEHAARTTGQEREELWERAALTTRQDEHAAQSQRELLIAQRGFVEAKHGAQLRWQVELFPLDERGRQQAAQLLRSALATLKPLPDALDQRIRESLETRSIEREDDARPAPSRYRDTRRNVEFRMAVATVDLAKVLPAGADRTAVLHQADAALRELTNRPKPDETAWVAEVLLIEVLRLRGDLDRVGPRVTALLGKDPPGSIRDAAVAQWVRANLDAGRPDDALQRLQQHRRAHSTDSDELTYLLIETLLAARRLAFNKQQPDLAHDLLTQAESFASNLTGAWGTRSRLLIDTAREADTYGPELADDVHRAKWAWRNGNLDEAITAYRRAVAEAHRTGQAEFAVEFAVTMASLQVEARGYDGAVVTLTGLLDNYPDCSRAPDAHLLRAYALGRQYEQKPDQQRLRAYRTALEEHRTKFADSPTASEATWMLARLEEHERNWPESIALLESIHPDSKHGPDAQVRLATVYEQALADQQRRGEPTEELEQRAIVALTEAMQSFPPKSEPLTASQAEIAWRLARMLLAQPQPDFALADSLLERVLHAEQTAESEEAQSHHADEADSTRAAAASQLRIISLAGQGRIVQAREFVQRLEAIHPDRLLDVMSGLTAAARQVALEHKQTVGTLQLEVSQRLEAQRETLSQVQRLKLDDSLAQAYAALGQIPQAAAVYEKILWQHPKDASVIESLARLYESCGTVSCIRNASKQWQALERLQQKGSAEWLESRYHMAWCSHQLGDDETARKLIGVTGVLYPDLGNPKLKDRFDLLSGKLQPATK